MKLTDSEKILIATIRGFFPVKQQGDAVCDAISALLTTGLDRPGSWEAAHVDALCISDENGNYTAIRELAALQDAADVPLANQVAHAAASSAPVPRQNSHGHSRRSSAIRKDNVEMRTRFERMRKRINLVAGIATGLMTDAGCKWNSDVALLCNLATPDQEWFRLGEQARKLIQASRRFCEAEYANRIAYSKVPDPQPADEKQAAMMQAFKDWLKAFDLPSSESAAIEELAAETK